MKIQASTGNVGFGTATPAFNVDNYYSDARIAGTTHYYVSATSTNTNTYIYIGRFTTYGTVTVNFTASGSSSFSANYATFTRQFNDKPTVAYLLNGDQYTNHQFYYQAVDYYSYDVWHRQDYLTSLAMRFHVSGPSVTFPTEPSSPTLTECAYGHRAKQFPGGGFSRTTFETGSVGIGTTNPGTKLDVNGGIRTRLPHLWARQTVQPANTTSLLLVWNSTLYNDTTLGNMYSTTRTCNFPIKGVYVVTVQVHSYYAGGASYYTDLSWVHKNSGGGARWTTYNNPRNLSQNSGNSDMHITGTMVIVADAGDYLEVTHGTSLSTSRNYNGGWNNIRAVCIYAIN
jgi:hypothetical protein